MSMLADTPFQNSGGISMSAVDALRASVKTKIDTANAPMMRHARSRRGGTALLPSITGNTGSTQGASIVKTPDI